MDHDTAWSHGAGGATRTSDMLGRIQWLCVNPDLPAEYYLSVKPGRNTIGQKVPVEFTGQPIRVTLEKGLLTTGTVIEAASGRAIPNLPLSLVPYWNDKSITISYRGTVETATDDQGRFHLNILEPGVYYVHSNDILHPTVEIIKKNGRISYRCIVRKLLDRTEATRLLLSGFASRSYSYRFFKACESSE